MSLGEVSGQDPTAAVAAASETRAITVPPDDVAFLGALAAERGWVLGPVLSSPEAAPAVPITGAHLAALSNEAWGKGSEHYSRTAASIVHSVTGAQPMQRGTVYRNARGALIIPDFIVTALMTDMDMLRGGDHLDPLDPAATRDWLQRTWDVLAFPYPLTIELADGGRDDSQERVRLLHAEVGGMEQARLATFLETRGYNSHALHGALGNAFNLLRLAAGVVDIAGLDAPNADMAFVTRKDVLTAARPLARRYDRGKLHVGVQDALQRQVKTGQPHKGGEVIVEGEVLCPFASTIVYEKIAAASLRSLVSRYDEADPLRVAVEQLIS